VKEEVKHGTDGRKGRGEGKGWIDRIENKKKKDE
jgi:hypothetical protein